MFRNQNHEAGEVSVKNAKLEQTSLKVQKEILFNKTSFFSINKIDCGYAIAIGTVVCC